MISSFRSIYHFDPANLPEPSNRQKRMERQKSLQATDDFEDKGDPKQTAIYQENCVSSNHTNYLKINKIHILELLFNR